MRRATGKAHEPHRSVVRPPPASTGRILESMEVTTFAPSASGPSRSRIVSFAMASSIAPVCGGPDRRPLRDGSGSDPEAQGRISAARPMRA